MLAYFLISVKGSIKKGGAVTITKNIRMLCKKQGISVSDLERTLGFGNGLIGKWEHSSPSISRLKSVANYFGVSIDALISEGDNDIELKGE